MYTSSADSSSLIFFSRGYPHTGQAIHPAFVGIEPFLTCFSSHGSNLLWLRVGHLAFRPKGDVLSGLNS